MSTQNTPQQHTVSTDDWREALFLLLLRAREIYQSTEELDEATVPQILQLFELAHDRGLKHTGSEMLAVLISSDSVEPDELAATVYMLEADGLLQREDFERAFCIEDGDGYA